VRHLALLAVAICLLLTLYGGWPVKVNVAAAPSNPKEIGIEWMNGQIRKTSFADGVDCYENRAAGYGSLSCVRRAS
jgi:hypothetical protein